MLVCKDADNTVRWKPGERLNHYFEERCDRLPPDHLAIIAEDATLTFRQLDDRANRTARYLLDQGLKAGDRIAVLFDKSIHAYVALLAIMKIGAAYVPLDESFPADRIAFILEDAAAAAIISVTRYREKLGAFETKLILLDSLESEVGKKSSARLSAEEAPMADDQLFYIIYTSGTTGKPKGVAIDHAGICNFVKVAGEVYGIGDSDRCYQGMTLAFDFHVESLWVPLIAGGTLIGGKSGANLFGADLHAFLALHKVTVFPCVPTLWATVEEDLPDVRVILLSGESVPHHLVVRWHRPGRTILNAYGPTECSVSSTLRKLEPDREVTIGIPLPTYTVVILDENKDAVVPDGEVGEIGIAGVALARGYVNREELTRQKFIPDFLNIPNNTSKHIYRTGDLGRIREDGELDFHGRIDTQVKLRGYRVELGEIEAVLMQVPEIAQAVVNPYEPEPGAVELVAYYTRKQGAGDISMSEVSETLRRQLPPYMVPGFLEELDVIPMTSNNKADRKNLPPPKGPRLMASAGKHVAASNKTEEVLSAALSEVMGIERISVADDFFRDLGAHSLLMARFGAEIRKRMRISAVSMRDIYLHPTIASLATHLDSIPQEADAESRVSAKPEPFHVASDLTYYGCGALQLVFYLAWSAISLVLLVIGIRWTYAAMPDLTQAYLRIVVYTLAIFVLASALPVLSKWVLIGRWKPEAIPVWSLRYFRFWVVRIMIRTAPMARVGGPIYNFYLRLLGARIGKHVVIRSALGPVCTDVISIGDNTVLRKDSIVLGYKAQSNFIHVGAIDIGSNVFVGEASVVDIDTAMEDDTQLGHSSSLHSGQRVPRGKHVHGTPAVETTANYCKVQPVECTTFRRITYSLVLLAAGFLLFPIPVIVVYSFFPEYYVFLHGPEFSLETAGGISHIVIRTAVASLIAFVVAVIGGLLINGSVPRLLNLFLKEDRTYPLYGVHDFVQQVIARLTNSVFYNRLFGDACGIVHYVRWIGYKLNKIVQTGSNFGEDQGHDNPFLCDIGSGTMVSDGLIMANVTMSSSSFKVGTVKIGEKNYLGNYVRYPVDGRTGANCLLGTKVLVPIDGPIRENVGLLGSPSFEIPRAVTRDTQMMAGLDEEARKQRLHAKNRYNFVTAVLFLLKSWFTLFIVALLSTFAYLYYPRDGLLAIFGFAVASFVFTVVWSWFVERASLGFGWLKPQISLALDPYYWFHERHWHLFGLTQIARPFAGTPMKNVFSRLEGVRMGKKVFDDGVRWTEYSLVSIGDHANLNVLSVVWPHSLEEGVFKSDRITIGAGCTLHSGSLTHYGVRMGDHVVLDAGAYLMKGEILDPHTTWRGNPAKEVTGRAAPIAETEAVDVFVPAKVA